MSKRTTPASKSTPETPAPRRRATKPVADAAPAEAPKAPRTRRKAVTSAVAAASDAAATPEVTAAPVEAARQPSHDEIAIRAYFISIERGADPVQAWLLAERELTTA